MQIRQSDMESAVGRLYLHNTSLELQLAEAKQRIAELEAANAELSQSLAAAEPDAT